MLYIDLAFLFHRCMIDAKNIKEIIEVGSRSYRHYDSKYATHGVVFNTCDNRYCYLQVTEEELTNKHIRHSLKIFETQEELDKFLKDCIHYKQLTFSDNIEHLNKLLDVNQPGDPMGKFINQFTMT